MSDDLLRARDSVVDEKSLVEFIKVLAADWKDERGKEAVAPTSRYELGANGWENGTIGQYLEAAAAWAEATISGTPFYTPPSNVWRRCADILYCGKIYE